MEGDSRHHQLSLSTQLHSQKVVLTVSYNKVQLIVLIVDALQKQKDRIGLTNHKLIVTMPDPVPVEISLGMIKWTCKNCKSARYSCSSAVLLTTIFCSCEGSLDCCNKYTRTVVENDDDDDDGNKAF